MCISVLYQEKIFSLFKEIFQGSSAQTTQQGSKLYTVFEGTLLINLHSYCYSVSIIVDVIEEVTKSFDFIEAIINIVVLLNYCPDASSFSFHFEELCHRKEVAVNLQNGKSWYSCL